MDVARFPPAIQDLLAEERLPPLGPGAPNERAGATLKGLTLEALFAPGRIRNANFARCCLAGLWLHHDFLDQSHEISQQIETPAGSYWHGLMHRREPDYSNAAYWFRRVGKHPVFDSLPAAARQAGFPSSINVPDPWNPFWFIDYCESCTKRIEPGEELARLLQKREWELLFHHCYRHAVS